MGLTFCGFTFGSVFRLVSNGYSSSSCNRDSIFIFNNVICNLGGVAIEEIDSSGNLVKDRKSSRTSADGISETTSYMGKALSSSGTALGESLGDSRQEMQTRKQLILCNTKVKYQNQAVRRNL